MKKNLLILTIMFSIIGLSKNSMAQWSITGLNSGTIYDIASDGTNVFAVQYTGVYRSSDNGGTWTQVNTGITNTDSRAIAIMGNNIFLGTVGGIFLSTDNGNLWTAMNNGLPQISITAFAVSGTNIYAATYSKGVCLSTDTGKTWTVINNGLQSSQSVECLASEGANVYAGGIFVGGGQPQSGIFSSVDNGSNWTSTTGLENQSVKSIAIIGTDVFAGTNGDVWISSNGSPWVSTSNGLSGKGFSEALIVIDNNIFVGNSTGVYLSTDKGSNWTDVTSGGLPASINSFTINGTTLFAAMSGGVMKRELSEMGIVSIKRSEVKNNIISIFPNPSSGIFQFDTKENINSIKVINLLGAEVYNESVKENGTKTVDLSHLPVGTYMLQIGSDKSVVTKKIEIKK